MERKGEWMQTFTGKAYWPGDPHVDDIDIVDIGHSLSLMCRYGGHCKSFYSVAEHSVLMSYLVGDDLDVRKQALMHDATEAYVIDIPRPLKRMMPIHTELEMLNWGVICKKFGVVEQMYPVVRDLDNRICLAEQEKLMHMPPPIQWKIQGPIPDVKIRCWSPWEAEFMFAQRFSELFEQKPQSVFKGIAVKAVGMP